MGGWCYLDHAFYLSRYFFVASIPTFISIYNTLQSCNAFSVVCYQQLIDGTSVSVGCECVGSSEV
jgi:hypothetical protein